MNCAAHGSTDCTTRRNDNPSPGQGRNSATHVEKRRLVVPAFADVVGKPVATTGGRALSDLGAALEQPVVS